MGRLTLRAPLGPRRVPFGLMAAGGAVLLVGSFLPWVRSGSRSRNSYDVFRVVGRLGFAPDGPASTALRWWPLVPLLTAVALVAVWWGWGRAGAAVGVAGAIYAGAIAVAVAAAPDAGLLDVGAGPVVTVLGAAVLLAGAVIALATRPAGRARP